MSRLVANEMILASAGSGKTYALGVRFLRILAAGADPARLLALTFTRKAASEFQQAILLRLADAASNPASAAALAGEVGNPALDCSAFVDMLADLVSALDRMNLGTIDSFFARVVQCFPFELGMTAPGRIMDDHAAAAARVDTYRKLFGRTAAEERERFFQYFKQATFGSEEKSLLRLLDRFVADHHDLFLNLPDADLWGRPARIFPKGCRFLDCRWDLESEAGELRDAVFESELQEGKVRRWEDFFEGLQNWMPGTPPPAPVRYILKNAIPHWRDLCQGSASITVARTAQPLSIRACKHLRRIIEIWVQGELVRSIQTAQGAYELLRVFEDDYAREVRGSGRLSFGDLPLLLTGRWDTESGRLRLGQGSAEDAGRLRIDYRLDGRFDHWMLDEFQDTSRLQWAVIEDLIDEIVQDNSLERSFFYVGDVKQAIYAWRGGDARLFHRVRDRYIRNDPEAIRMRHLSRTWRCAPAVVAAVNRVFGNPTILSARFPEAAVARWMRDWREHESARTDPPGCAALWEARGKEARFALMEQRIREADPLGRGLSCAVLVRDNSTAGQVVEFLRGRDIPAARDGAIRPGDDNLVGLAVSALVKAALYPRDVFAWRYLLMTPLGRRVQEEGMSRSDVVHEFLEACAGDGMEAALQPWLRDVLRDSEDPFTRDRTRRIVRAARQFDREGGGRARGFDAFLQRYTDPETISSDTVQVMTMHKSKGLSFDMVLLPDLEVNQLTSTREDMGVFRDAEGQAQWILPMPVADVCEIVPELRDFREHRGAESCYEGFCLLYVAMTRARYALHAMIDPPAKNGPKANYRDWLREAWTAESESGAMGETEERCLAHEGERHWWNRHHLRAASADGQPGPDAIPDTPTATGREVPRLLPSDGATRAVRGDELFAAGRSRALRRGSRVHQWLSGIGWIEEVTPELQRQWRVEAAAAGDGEFGSLLTSALESGPIRACFERPDAERVELWREKPFEMIADGQWVSGVFDRVVVVCDTTGRPLRATIYDFKTDSVAAGEIQSLAERYAAQLALYREALGRLLELPASEITCRLVFLAAGEVVSVDATSDVRNRE